MPENSSLMTEYCSGLTNLMRKETCSMSGVVHCPRLESPLSLTKFSYASSFDSS